MYTLTYTHMYTYTYTHRYMYTHIYIYIYPYTHAYIYTHIRTHINIHTHIHIYIYTLYNHPHSRGSKKNYARVIVHAHACASFLAIPAHSRVQNRCGVALVPP
jgi:hypothetical protein